jgi:molybdopterin molybdotransferase
VSSVSLVSSPLTLAPLGIVLEELKALAAPSPPRILPVRAAAGLELAEDLVARSDVPPRAVALIAGFAVAPSDLVGVSAYAPALLAERPPFVAAGSVLPAGTDAVVPADAVTEGPATEIVMAVSPGENVRRAGEDAVRGQILRRRGEVLRPLDVPIAIEAGIAQAACRGVRMTLLCAPEHVAALEPLRASLPSGIHMAVLPLAADPAGGWYVAADAGSDLVLVLADPAGRGMDDQARVLAKGLALRGAEDVSVAVEEGRPVVVVPPRTGALLTVLHGLVLPHLSSLAGQERRKPTLSGRLTRKIASSVGLTELALLRPVADGLQPLGVGALTLAAWAQADALLVVPPESEGYPEGAFVEALCL